MCVKNSFKFMTSHLETSTGPLHEQKVDIFRCFKSDVNPVGQFSFASTKLYVASVWAEQFQILHVS